jgi:hypothetical protein
MDVGSNVGKVPTMPISESVHEVPILGPFGGSTGRENLCQHEKTIEARMQQNSNTHREGNMPKTASGDTVPAPPTIPAEEGAAWRMRG